MSGVPSFPVVMRECRMRSWPVPSIQRGGFGGDAGFVGLGNGAGVEAGIHDFVRALLVEDRLHEIEFSDRGLNGFFRRVTERGGE